MENNMKVFVVMSGDVEGWHKLVKIFNEKKDAVRFVDSCNIYQDDHQEPVPDVDILSDDDALNKFISIQNNWMIGHPALNMHGPMYSIVEQETE